jgi:hypothetical protein
MAAKKAPAKKATPAKKANVAKPSSRKPRDYSGADIAPSAGGKRIADEAMTAKAKARKKAIGTQVGRMLEGQNAYSMYVRKAQGSRKK